MPFIRKAAIAAAASLLACTLFSFGFAWSFHQVFGTSRDIKQALSKSGIYQSVVAEVLRHQQTSQQGNGVGSNNIPIDQPQVKQVIQNAFPPQFLQAQSEQVINAVYAWLNSKTPALQFTIDLSAAKVKLADGIGQYATAHLSSLPACAANAIPTGTIDPLNATCVPAGFDIAAASATARDSILHGDFLKNSNISADSIKNSSGKTLSQQLQPAPKVYNRVNLGVYASGVLALVWAIAIVFASTNRRSGLRKVSTTIITIGAISAALGFLSSFAVHEAANKIASAQTGDKALQQQLITIVQSLADNLRTWWAGYGATLIVLSVVILLTLHLTRPKSDHVEAAQPPDEEQHAQPQQAQQPLLPKV
jgi:hypothetical protein